MKKPGEIIMNRFLRAIWKHQLLLKLNNHKYVIFCYYDYFMSLYVINDNYSIYKLLVDTPTITVVKPNVSEVFTEIIPPTQNISNQTNLPDKNTSTDETVSQIMLKEVLEDVQIFQLQLEDILKLSLNSSKLKVRKISYLI